jgi:hypothetical protein
MNTKDFSTGTMFDDMFPDILRESFPNQTSYQHIEKFHNPSTRVFFSEIPSTNNSCNIDTKTNLPALNEDPWKTFVNGTTNCEDKASKDDSSLEETQLTDVTLPEEKTSEGYAHINANSYNQIADMLKRNEEMNFLNNDSDVNNNDISESFWPSQTELQTTADSNFDSGIGDTDDSVICESEKTHSTPHSVVFNDKKNKDSTEIAIGFCEQLQLFGADLIDSDKNLVSNINIFDIDKFSNELENSLKLPYNYQPPNRETAIPVLQLPPTLENVNIVEAVPAVFKTYKNVISTVRKIHKSAPTRRETILSEISKLTKEQMIAIFSNMFDQHNEALEASLQLFRQGEETSQAGRSMTQTRRKVGRPKKYFTKLAKKEAKAKADAKWYKKKMELRAQENAVMRDL